MDKDYIISEAISITKEYARGGGQHPAPVLGDLVDKLVEIYKNIDKE